MSNQVASNYSTNEKKFTGYHMLAVMVLFFGTIITVNLTLAYFAANSWTGLIVKNTYIASQVFDDERQVREQQQALGWQLQTNYQNGIFELNLSDVNGFAVETDRVDVELGRPVHETDDTALTLTENGNAYMANIDLGAGVWHADVTAYLDEQIIWTKPVRFIVE